MISLLARASNRLKSYIAFLCSILLIFGNGCLIKSNSPNIIGTWHAEKIEYSDGTIITEPDLQLIISNKKYQIVRNDTVDCDLDYEVEKDEKSYFFKLYYDGQLRGERFYLSGNESLKLEDNGYINGKYISMEIFFIKN